MLGLNVSIRLGEREVTVLETPGHTYGTASCVFNVSDGASIDRPVTVGGLGLNAIEGLRLVEAFIASADRIAATMHRWPLAPTYSLRVMTKCVSLPQTSRSRMSPCGRQAVQSGRQRSDRSVPHSGHWLPER